MNVVVALVVIAVSASLAIGAILLVRRNAPEAATSTTATRRGRVRRPGDRLRRPPRPRRRARVQELRRRPHRRRDRGADRRAAVRGGASAPTRAGARARRGAHLLRPLGHPSRVAADVGRHPDRRHEPVGRRAVRSLRTVEPRTAAEQAAYSKWLDQRLDRAAARGARIHGASSVIPSRCGSFSTSPP
jgi:hypothetical protein